MSAQSMLEQLFKSAQQTLAPKGGTDWGSFGKGAATGGLLGLLVGTQSGRRLGGKALKYGSLAALGALAYKAYDNWQQQQQQQRAPGAAAPAPAAPPQALPAPEAEQRSRRLLKAMVAAAKADGHLDDAERAKVEEAFTRLEADTATRQWLEAELRRPLDPADVARDSAGAPEQASEVYLASLLVVDETSTMERLYLDELARQLRMPDDLRRQLEAQAAAAGAGTS